MCRGIKLYFDGKTFLIEGRNTSQSWVRALKLIAQQQEIIAGEDYLGNAKMTKDANITIVLDNDAVEDIRNADYLHPAFEQGILAIKEYDKEFTYDFVKNNWEKPEKYQFVYNYMDRFINYPIPTVFIYQGKLLEFNIPEKYFCRNRDGGLTGGLDQLKCIHDAIRTGISRRTQLITWIPAIDDFNPNPPCLQRIWIRVLAPKYEWSKYSNQIPVEVHISYRSWDFGRAILSNLYGLINCLYRYVLGNLTEDTEMKGDEINKYNYTEFSIEKLVLSGDSCHVYEDNYSIFTKA